jgi:hypothetical protein
MEKLPVPQLVVFDHVDKTVLQFDCILCHCSQERQEVYNETEPRRWIVVGEVLVWPPRPPYLID